MGGFSYNSITGWVDLTLVGCLCWLSVLAGNKSRENWGRGEFLGLDLQCLSLKREVGIAILNTKGKAVNLFFEYATNIWVSTDCCSFIRLSWSYNSQAMLDSHFPHYHLLHPPILLLWPCHLQNCPSFLSIPSTTGAGKFLTLPKSEGSPLIMKKWPKDVLDSSKEASCCTECNAKIPSSLQSMGFEKIQKKPDSNTHF